MPDSTKYILAVDDEPSMLRLLEISLRQAGYQPLTARDGREALEVINAQQVDCVVTDLHMPRMDGLQLLKEVRKTDTELPVIIVTAQGEIGSAIDAMKNGASDYILRPFDLAELELAIKRALSFSRLVVENRFLREDKADTTGLIGNSPAMQHLAK